MERVNSQKKTYQQVLLSALGSSLEYYDFVICGAMFPYLKEVFFPYSSGFFWPSFLVGVGYLGRPIGGLFLGRLSDQNGRKNAFLLSILLMTFSTLGIAFLPSFQIGGFFSLFFLLFFRFIQGVSFGGEIPSSTMFLNEIVPENKRGRALGWMLSGTSIGAFMATGVLSVLTRVFDEKALLQGGWRFPFFVGGILGLAFFSFRKKSFQEPLQNPSSSESKPILFPFFCMGFFALAVMGHIYLPALLPIAFAFSLKDIYSAMSFGIGASFFWMILSGYLMDLYNKRILLLFSFFSFLLSNSLFLFFVLKRGVIYLPLFFIQYQLWLSMMFVGIFAYFPKTFHKETRCLAFSLLYNLAFLLASFLPFIANLVKSAF